SANTKLSEEMLANWDFHAVSCVGDKVWIVGRPGSAVFCSEDKGKNWQINKTGQNVPLNAVHFFDEKRGWTVGELGTILATADGGKTWTIQNRGGKRAAVLCVHARSEDLPADTVAMLGGDQGLLTVALRVAGPDPKSAAFGDAAQGQRFAAAHRVAGGASGEMLWQFPVPQDFINADKTTLLKFWDSLHGDHAAQQMLRQLVLAIRMWQPELVLTDHPDPKVTGCAAGALVAEALHEAFKLAADPQAFPEQIEQLGLKTWQVAKVYGLWDKRDGSHVQVDNSREIAQLQATYAEHAAVASRLFDPCPVVPMLRHFRLLDAVKAGAPKDLLDGIDFGGVGDCRRPAVALAELDPKLTAAIKSQRQFVALAKNPGNGLTESPQLLGQLGVMLAKLPEDRAAKAAHIIASEFARQGQWELAREAFIEMIERYPLHPLSADAYRWLIRHNTSSEARRRQELGQFLIAPQTPAKGVLEPALFKDPKSPSGVKLAPVVQQGAFLGDPGQLQHWNQGSLALGKRLSGMSALYANDPSIQACLQSANRRLGKFKEAQDYFSAYCAEYTEGPWREAALQELWFVNRTGMPPRPVAQCRFTSNKPYLDGKFDDACWQGIKPVVLKDSLPIVKRDEADKKPGLHETAKEYPTEVMLSFDDKYLYVALRCKHPAGQGVPPAKERPRDADLRSFDRVSILLDLDRDYSTYFRLEVDQRGCVCEDCWGDKRWNPQWYVAIKSDEDCWQVEAAIPLHDLTGDRVMPGAAWACNVVRILPGRGVQAMSTPAGVEPRPEGMGLVLFQKEQ
ncbi:MAG TPA: hypothetical protein VE988_19160, partial [Gemmataceae bacterium]|nr:hypothetical protein [Gemmataceae bacterium]